MRSTSCFTQASLLGPMEAKWQCDGNRAPIVIRERRHRARARWSDAAYRAAPVGCPGMHSLRHRCRASDLSLRIWARRRRSARPRYMLLLMAAWVGVEAHTFIWVSRRIRQGRGPVRSRAYLRAAFEVAMPTAMMAIMCQYDRPLNVLTSSITYVYFLVIILSPLSLDPRLCLFIGALAALCYGALVGAYADVIAREWVGPVAIEHLTFVMRGALLFGGGLSAAFVSQRIRTTILEAFREVQERERVVALFGQHVSPTVVDQLLYQSPGAHSELRKVCVMVLDIRDVTTFSESRA